MFGPAVVEGWLDMMRRVLIVRRNRNSFLLLSLTLILSFSLTLNIIFIFTPSQNTQSVKPNPSPSSNAVSLVDTIPYFWKLVQLEVNRFKRSQSRQKPEKTSAAFNSAGEKCEPRVNGVGFLKTHKTGSSTVFSILSRFAVERELSVAVPSDAHLGVPLPYSDRHLLPPRLRRYHMLFNHVIFSDHSRKVLGGWGLSSSSSSSSSSPSSGRRAFWLTVLRDPIDTYISVYNYFRINSVTGVPFSTFITDPEYYLDVMDVMHDNVYLGTRVAARGLQLQFDLGLDLNSSADDVIAFMEDKFDVVLIAELLESSLAHLAKRLCWPLESMTFFTQNQRSERESMSRRKRRFYWTQLQPIIGVYAEVYKHFLRRQQFYFYHFNLSGPANTLKQMNERLRSECLVQPTEAVETHNQQQQNTPHQLYKAYSTQQLHQHSDHQSHTIQDSDVTKITSDDVTKIKTDDVTKSKSDDVTETKSNDVTKSKNDDVTKSKTDDVTESKNDDVTKSKSDDVTLVSGRLREALVDLEPSYQPVRMETLRVREGAPFHCRMRAWPESTWTELLKYRHVHHTPKAPRRTKQKKLHMFTKSSK